MADSSEFESICPYNDAEAVEALNKVANHPAVLAISEYLFPDEPIFFLRNALKSVHNIDVQDDPGKRRLRDKQFSSRLRYAL